MYQMKPDRKTFGFIIKTSPRLCLGRLRPVLAFSIVLVVLAFPPPAMAQSQWWQKGADLLKRIGNSAEPGELTTTEISSGLKDALRVGTATVVEQLGQLDGFNSDPSIHIPLPRNLETVRSTLAKVGMSVWIDNLELQLNRAAETATPKAKSLFLDAITGMTLDDVMGIYKGPDDAATRFFQRKMTASLAEAMQPIVSDSLNEVGAVRSYDAALSQYRSLPFVPDVKADLTAYVIEKGMNGIFYYLAREEAAIRQNPAKRTTEILKRVFKSK